MFQSDVSRRCRRKVSTEALSTPTPMDIDDGNDSTSISSSLSSDSSNHGRHRRNKKPRLETNSDGSIKCSSGLCVRHDVLYTSISIYDDSSISPLSVKRILSSNDVKNEQITISNDIFATKTNEVRPSLCSDDISAVSASTVHVISPMPSHLDLLLLSPPSLKPASPMLSNASLTLEINEFRKGAIASGELSAVTRPRSRGRVIILFLVALLAIVAAISGFFNPTDTVPNSVYVTGGGFSGFWFTLGRLQGVLSDHSEPKHLYCYSSGCLALVAALSRYSMEEMWNIAHNVQIEWKQGQISRYDVVETFVDDLLFGPDRSTRSRTIYQTDSFVSPYIRLRPIDLASLKVITTASEGWWGVKTSIRSAKTVAELRTMLIQTTWIPFAIGNGLWYNGHMDGAFTTPFHPLADVSVGLELDWDLYANVLNVNLGRDKVEKFWNKGRMIGL